MKSIKIGIISIVTIIFLHSCFVLHRGVIEDFGRVYDGKTKDYSSKICHNGYYEMRYLWLDDSVEDYSEPIALLFFEDGIYISSRPVSRITNDSGELISCKKEITMGVYEIVEDTIIAKYLHVGSSTSSCIRKKFLIIDSLGLQQFFYGHCKSPYQEFGRIADPTVATFKPYEFKFDYDDLWIKQERWFWLNDELYEDWIRSRRD
jgi:hypothetical protein